MSIYEIVFGVILIAVSLFIIVFTLAQENGAQTFGVRPATGRYVVILVTESYRDNGLACIAEFYAYGLNN